MLERGLDCLVAGAFGPKRMTLLLIGLPHSLHTSISLSPASSVDFSPTRQKKGTESFSFTKNTLKSFKNRFPVYLLKKTAAFSYKNTISPIGPDKGMVFPQFYHLRNRKKKQW